MGNFLGGTAAYLFAQRRKPKPPGLMGQIAYALFGSFIGGVVCMPFGMLLATKHLRGVEDPKHLASVMQSAVDQRRGRPPLPVTRGGPPAPEGGQEQGTGAGPGVDVGYGSTERSQGAFSGSLSDQNQSMPYASSSSSYYSPPDESYKYNDGGANSNGEREGPMQQQQQQQQTTSRWAQLRGERGVQASAWDRIRQERARDSMSSQRSSDASGSSDRNAAGPYGFEAGPQGANGRARESRYGSAGELADPTFGKGSSNNRDQARQEFEASFEREKRGLDG